MIDLASGIVTAMSASAYKITDSAVLDAVNDRIGYAIAVDAVKARMHARKYPDFTDFFLDDLALIRVYAPTLTLVDGVITVVVKHERLAARPDPLDAITATGLGLRIK